MNLGLDHTFNRVYLNTVTHNDVSEATAGIYFKNQTYWLDKLRTITGVRGDYIHNDVTETDNTLHDPLVNAANSGDSHKARVSPKLSVILGPWYNTEYFVNAGYGYHSNDARGTVLHLNPVDGTPFVNGNPISPVSPLAWSRGAETGIRSKFIQGLNITLTPEARQWLAEKGFGHDQLAEMQNQIAMVNTRFRMGMQYGGAIGAQMLEVGRIERAFVEIRSAFAGIGAIFLRPITKYVADVLDNLKEYLPKITEAMAKAAAKQTEKLAVDGGA
jgi:hypothetical protein